MLLFARLVAALTAIIAIVNIAVGAMTDPDFLVPDILLAILLAAAALTPARWGAPVVLIASLAFALGVFGVAVSAQVNDGEINPGLIALMAADAAALAGLPFTGLRTRAATG